MLRYGGMKNPPLWGKIVIKFSHLLLTLSSAINIIIYSYKVDCSMYVNFNLDISELMILILILSRQKFENFLLKHSNKLVM